MGRRRGALSGFVNGFAGGMSIGNSIRGVMNESELAKESDSLSQKISDSGKYVANEGGGLRQVMPDKQAADNFAAYNNNIASEDAATFGQGALSSAPTTTVEQAPAYTRADYYSDMGRKASGLGMFSTADKYQERADRQKANDLNQQEQGQRIEKGKLELDQAKEQQASAARVSSFTQAVQEAHDAAAKNGGVLTWDQIQQMGVDAKLKPSEVISAASALTGLDEQGTKYTVGMRVAQFDKAYHTGGLDALKNLYHTNPLFDDGSNIDFKPAKDGKVLPLINGKPLTDAPMSEAETAVYLRNRLTDPYSAVKFNMEVLQNQAKLASDASKLKVDAANINQSNASAANSLASAAKTRQETADLKTSGGAKPDDVRQNTQAAVKQVLLATGLAKQDPVGNLFMQSLDGKPSNTSEQDIANLSASAEAYVRKGMPPYQAAQQVIKDRATQRAAARPPANRPPLSSFGK